MAEFVDLTLSDSEGGGQGGAAASPAPKSGKKRPRGDKDAAQARTLVSALPLLVGVSEEEKHASAMLRVVPSAKRMTHSQAKEQVVHSFLAGARVSGGGAAHLQPASPFITRRASWPASLTTIHAPPGS